MKKKIILLVFLIIALFLLLFLPKTASDTSNKTNFTVKKSYWLVLQRKSNKELLYFGVLGDVNNSKLMRTFQVKAGVPGVSPTPLPRLLGREYWLLVKKESSEDNPETAPYFLQLDIPATGEWPYGPVPYEECLDDLGNKTQCDWDLPGYFGLHGINGDLSKLSKEDLGSSGCVRHSDEDITYLFNLLNPEKEEIRYYIEDI